MSLKGAPAPDLDVAARQQIDRGTAAVTVVH